MNGDIDRLGVKPIVLVGDCVREELLEEMLDAARRRVAIVCRRGDAKSADVSLLTA